MRIALIGDGRSPHLLKWAGALTAVPDVDLWAASSREFLPGFDAVVDPSKRLALGTQASHAGGNIGVLRTLPRLALWLRRVDADWLHAHYLTSHGTLAMLARHVFRVRGRLVGSAWGSDILLTPERSAAIQWLTRRVLHDCLLTTSDSAHMARRMRELGAREVMTFPLGLDALPPEPGAKQPWRFYANRALEPLYRPERVLDLFAPIAMALPEAQLVFAHDGSLRGSLEQRVRNRGMERQVRFVGHLDAASQAREYAQAQWYVSQPQSDSIAVSVLEAMAQGCIPILSDLPANRELVRDGSNGLIVPEGVPLDAVRIRDLLDRARAVARENRAWVAQHALFAPAVERFVARLRELA